MIEVRNLKKAFGPKVAVNGVSFTVGKGEVLGFPGPNGAGKITGFVPPTDGAVTIGGHDVVNPAELRGLTGPKRREAVGRVVEMCFLESVRHQSVETLSKEMDTGRVSRGRSSTILRC